MSESAIRIPSLWQKLFSERITIDAWNADILPLMRTEGEEFKQAAASEAKRRHYHACKDQQCYVEMKITKGHGIIRVGWSRGVLFAQFSAPKVYGFKNAPQEDAFKLQRSIYPDRLFQQLKAKWQKEAA